MKIVFGTDVFYPVLEAGGEVHTFNVAQNLVKFGHEVTVLSGKSSQFIDDPIEKLNALKDEEEVEGIRIIRMNKAYRYGSTVSSLPALFEMYRTLNRMIRNNEVDIINFVLYRPCVPFIFAARKRIPTVLTVHLLSEGFGNWKGWKDYDAGIIGGFAQKAIENIVLRFPYDKVITVSDTFRTELTNYFPKEKIEVVYNGVDLDQYSKVEVRQKKTNQIIYVGALKKRKNILDAIYAVKMARKIIKDLTLVIVSGGGECEEIVSDIIKKEGFIEYYKKITDEQKIRLLKESSLFVFPSSYESFGLVLIEALVCNTSFIAYDIPAIREVNSLTSGGILVPYGEIELLTQQICKLLVNRDKLKELGDVGKKNVEKKFTWTAVAKRYEKIFNDVLEDNKL